ncbi:MAG: DUF4982 domain-containing protein [Firmicutes bacterium]|nr:DUF4982 domain-containing protein [Bacillota bacterium]
MRRCNDGWQFARGEPENFAPVALPHDWLIADTNRLYESGAGWYRRELDAGFLAEGQRLFLHFDGVYMDSALYVNGQRAGAWKYGYTAFEHELTDYISREKPNTLLLEVRYQSPCERWYTGAGIYRDVFLKVKNACHFAAGGIYITTAKADGRWTYEVDAEAETGGRPFTLRHTLLDAEGGIEAWDIENPRLYTLRSDLFVDGALTDTEYTRFGFRTAEFTPDRGFFLNGRHVKLRGVCLHHDLGGLGAAVHPDAIRRQLALLRAMGVNAVRTAHNPPAKIFMDLADEMGFLVLSELTDVWHRPKNPYDYSRFFDEWVERDAASWILRDRNHPSVILWSVGNEIYDTHADARNGGDTLRRLMALVRRYDPKGHAPATLCSNYMPWENTQKCADIIKLIGYNYAENLYAEHHRDHPDWILFGGETCSTVQSRGVYHFPLSVSTLADDDLQCSALGNSATSWGAKSVEECLRLDAEAPFSLGQFLWAGQDYLGEPTPYHTKNAYLGHMDTAGFPKDSYYLIQAAWTDFEKTPMIHLFPYWDFSPGQPIDVRVCSNAPRVELFFNGESVGAAELGKRFVADFRLPYRPGALRAVAYDEQGRIAAEANRRSFGDAADLRLSHETIGDLTFTAITTVDAEGNPVENANCRVAVSVADGTLLALDNGDSTDYEQYTAKSRRLFSGKLLAISRARPGKTPAVTAALDREDIPIRKIELTASGYAVTAKVFPPNATYRDLYWRLTDAAGIESPLGTLAVAPDGQSAAVCPKGDGEVIVRCSPKNGRAHFAFISQLPLTLAGYGKPLLDPYGFVSGGLYTASNVALTNGNERGICTLRDGESHVGFENLDFGDFGSDELTLPLFPLDREPFLFEIWEGMPLAGGKRLMTARYDKGSLWNTYQQAAYRLPRRLKGVTTLCFVFRQKVHLKGFLFARQEKAFQRLLAAACDGLYGDSFAVQPDGAVERIAGNVTLTFNHMNFGARGVSSVRLCWRSALPENSVQFSFAGGGTETRRMVRLPRADQYAQASFLLGEKIAGEQTVSLIFLPGCALDLRWLEFMG